MVTYYQLSVRVSDFTTWWKVLGRLPRLDDAKSFADRHNAEKHSWSESVFANGGADKTYVSACGNYEIDAIDSV